jgi:hypothetical protein
MHCSFANTAIVVKLQFEYHMFTTYSVHLLLSELASLGVHVKIAAKPAPTPPLGYGIRWVVEERLEANTNTY